MMIFTTEQLKDFFRENKEALKGVTCVFRYNRNQIPTNTLRETGEMILKLAENTDQFSIGSVWFENGKPQQFEKGLKKFIEAIQNDEICSFALSPYRKVSECEQIRSHGSLD